MSLLIISYHYTSSITFGHPVYAGCLLSRHVLLEHLEPQWQDQLVIPKHWNLITTLCCVRSQEDSRSQNIQKLGIMKPSMWMICHRSNSGQLHILVVTRMLIIGEPDKMLIDLRNRKEADSYLLSEWRVWSVVWINNFPTLVFPYCTSVHSGKVGYSNVTASLIPQPTLLAGNHHL
jgi:hypothetical protein